MGQRVFLNKAPRTARIHDIPNCIETRSNVTVLPQFGHTANNAYVTSAESATASLRVGTSVTSATACLDNPRNGHARQSAEAELYNLTPHCSETR